LPVTDAAIVASKADGVLIVVKAGHTRKNSLHGVIEILNNVGAEIFGVVINMVPPFARGEQYGYSYNRYETKYSYLRYYSDSKNEPYAPLKMQSNDPETGPIRVPLDVRLRAKFRREKKVKTTSVDRAPQLSQQFDKEIEDLVDQMMKKKSKKHS
jgi:hypothetical protein